MTQVHVARDRLAGYLKAVFPGPPPEANMDDPQYQRVMRRARENRLWAAHFFDQGKGNRQPGVAGTLWAAYNGVTEFVDHRQMPHATAGDRLSSIWFGDGYYIKARAFRVAEDKTKEWRN